MSEPVLNARPLIEPVSLVDLAKLIRTGMVGTGDELTPAEVARELGVSPSTVRRWGVKRWLVPTRRLPGSRYRRYARADVDEFRRRLAAGEFDEAPPTS